jgi:hypothetical protein
MIDASMVDMTPYLLETFESVQRQVHFRHASFLDRITVSACVEMLHSIATQSFPIRAHHSISAPFPLHDIQAEDVRARCPKVCSSARRRFPLMWRPPRQSEPRRDKAKRI